MPSSSLLRRSCGAVILAFDDIFTRTLLFKGPIWPGLLPQSLNLTGVGGGSHTVWASPQV